MSCADPAWLLRGVELNGDRVDCRLRGGTIAEIAPAGRLAPAGPAAPGGLAGPEQVLDGHGGALLPGLADHHIHVFALAAARRSSDLRGGSDLAAAADGDGDWLRVIGAGSELTLAVLDERWPATPVRVQHRGGRLWMLNSVAIDRLAPGLDAEQRRTGRIWDDDPRLRELLDDAGVAAAPDLAAVGRELAAHGITHLTDATPELESAAVARLRAELPQRVSSMAPAGDGPRKLVLSELAPPDLDGLAATIAREHGRGRPVAIHTVTDATLALALAAVSIAGPRPGDRLEHVAVCDDAAAERIAALGPTVVTQPTIYARHRDAFRAGTPAPDRALLWRHAGLRRRGVAVAVSSDAPYGDPDPAATIAACAARREPEGTIAPREALATMLTDPRDPAGAERAVAPGAAADLCLLDGGLDEALRTAAAGGRWPVRATFVAGRCVHGAGRINHLSV